MKKAQRLDSLDLLRGMAVIMVCVCHFGGTLSFEDPNTSIFHAFGIYGRYGVHMFFVISGFVIPLSLYIGKFWISNYFTFLQKGSQGYMVLTWQRWLHRLVLCFFLLI
jgi:surface polysaccharide O-acyltransferase-like enzyme